MLDLSEKHKTLLEYIKQFQEEKGRNPRLSELTAQFEVSNSAILQRLELLESYGYIDMPDGVLSISTRPRYDIFISYSSQDKDIAKKLYNRLEKDGFRIWKDDSRLKLGDYFTTEIFSAIRNSKIFLILLSDNSLQSKFVKEELSHAKNQSIYKDNPQIFPVVINKLTLEVFPDIANLHRQEVLDLDDESQMIRLLDDIQLKAFSSVNSPEPKKYNSNFSSFKDEAIKNLDEKPKLNKEYDYFQFQLDPFENPHIKNVMEMEKILENTKIDIKRWGGFDIPPFYPNTTNLKAEMGQNAIKFYKEFSDKDAWFRDWELYYFNIDINGNFFYRNSLRESYARDEKIRDTFAIDWLLLDVTRSLMFAKKLIENTACKKWKYTLEYKGLKDKKLIILNPRRHSFFWEMKYADNEYNKALTIDSNTSIVDTAYDICHELLWLFGWKNVNEPTIRKDITVLSQGVFPE